MSIGDRLLLVALLAAPLFAAACDEFRCKNGACARFHDICDGADDCGDGSDELASRCSGNTVPLALNQNVTVRVQFKSPQRSIDFLLCDSMTCSSITVDSIRPDGGMSYAVGTNCNVHGRGCHLDFSHVDGTPVVSGEYQFVVGRSPGKFAVWQKGSRQRATVSTTASTSLQLQVRPLRWASDLDVEFSAGEYRVDAVQAQNVTGPSAKPLLRVGAKVFRGPDWKWESQDGNPPGPGQVVTYTALMRLFGIVTVRWQSGNTNTYRMGAEDKYDLAVLDDPHTEGGDAVVEVCPEFRCKSGGCARFIDKCDGLPDCADKSDEDATMCRANTLALPEGRNTTARIQFKSEHGYLEFHMCGRHTCSHVDVHGLTPAGKLSYVQATDCNENSRLCALNFTHLSPGKHFDSGELEFVVARKPGQLAVWRHGHPEDVATVKVSGDADTLQIQPGNWASDVQIQYTPVGEGEATLATPAGRAGGAVVSGRAALPLIKVGARVMRGRDWQWGDQDGASQGPGLGRITSTGLLMRLAGVVGVRWDNGHENVYRMNRDEGTFDLAVLAEESPSEDASTSTSLTVSAGSDEDTAATGVVVGSRVVRGKDWVWDDQDGTPPGEGVVVSVDTPFRGWVSVRWPSGKEFNYRMSDKRDLKVLDSSATPTQPPATTAQSSTSTESVEDADADASPTGETPTQTPTSTSQSFATSTQASPTTEWEWFRPHDGNDSRAESATPTMSSAADDAGRVVGAEAAMRLKPCSRVVRGKDWKWGSQDGTPGGEGRVVSAVTNAGWVSVRWPSGDNNLYRMGADGKYDLDLLEKDEAPSAEADPHCALDKRDEGDKGSRHHQPEVISAYTI